MERNDFILAVLSSGRGAAYRPVQVQKLFFLIDRNIPELVGGPFFSFAPYDYGPFDKAVYEALEQLAGEGDVEVCPQRTWNNYRLTANGQAKGERLFRSLDSSAQNYITRASNFVTRLSFTKLVSAIYKAYPEMRANSVFQE